MRVLLDINILVRANEKSRGPARALLLELIKKRHTLLTSREMLVELAAVLRYPRLQALYGLTDEQVYQYIQFLQEVSDRVTVDPTLKVPMRDPKDVAILQAAVIGEADVLCTLDKDFYAPETKAFCSILRMEICTDVELAAKIRSS